MKRFQHNLSLNFLILIVLASNATPANDFSRGINQFAKEFYLQCVKEKPGNVIVSPLSVSTILALLSQGSVGNTYEELRQTLHLDNDRWNVAKQFLEHRETLHKNAGESTLSIANGVFVQQDYQLSNTFEWIAITKFKSNIELLDFAEPEKSAATINNFVQKETKGEITDLIQPDQFDSDTRSVLVNAIYFKGNWEKPFLEEDTRKNDFYNSETEKVQVDFMHKDDDFNFGYIDELRASALELKYANSNIAFVFVLPESRTGLADLEAKLKDYDFTKISENLIMEECKVQIPKFKIEYEIKLNEVLMNMGIVELFSDTSNLRGLLDSEERLKVSDIVHKAVIEINERGTIAAAATEIDVARFSSIPPSFIADHPFMYFIRDIETDTILFSGHITRFD